eukprot:tig00021357_g20742.t1
MDEEDELAPIAGDDTEELDELNDETFGDAVVDGADWDKQQELLARQSEFFEQLRVTAKPTPEKADPEIPVTIASQASPPPGSERRIPGVLALEDLEARLNQCAVDHGAPLASDHERQHYSHIGRVQSSPIREPQLSAPLEMHARPIPAFHSHHASGGHRLYQQPPSSQYPQPGRGLNFNYGQGNRQDGGSGNRFLYEDRCPPVIGNSYMTQDEVEVIIRQQSMQLNTANPFVDDYYYINYCASRLDDGYMRQIPVSLQSQDNRGAGGKENTPPAQPAIWQTVLGRTQPFNIRAPRQLIQLSEESLSTPVGHIGSTKTSTISATAVESPGPVQQVPDRPAAQSRSQAQAKAHHSRSRASLIARLAIENALLALGDVSDLTKNLNNAPDAPFAVQYEQQRSAAVSKLFQCLHVEPIAESDAQAADEQNEILVTMFSMKKGKRLLALSLPHFSQEQAFTTLSSICANCIPLLSASYSRSEKEEVEAEQETETLALFMQAIIEAVGRQPLHSLCSLIHTLLATYPVPSIFTHLLVLEAGMIFVDAILQAGHLLSTSGKGDDVSLHRWKSESKRLADIVLGKPDVPGVSLEVFLSARNRAAVRCSANMSGRGKGGKGLGKGGAKRHRKVLRDNIQGITKPAIRRLARRGGVKRISGLIYDETRGVLKVFLENVIRDAVTYTEHARRKTVTALDVVYALKRQGRTLYGFGG